jgi:negative regulator of genetic competence, sporulation and motility
MYNDIKKQYDQLKQSQQRVGNKNNYSSPIHQIVDQNHSIANNEDRVKEIKLNRALEDIEKYKKQVNELKKEHREQTDKSRKQMDQLRKEIKRVERQKQDLILSFKKQMKLIDILKRQKIHLEASRFLSITEEQFMKVMDIAK